MSESVTTVPPFVAPPPVAFRRHAANPTSKEWLTHGALFLATFFTTTLAGIVLAAPDVQVPEPPLTGMLDYLWYVPVYYVQMTLAFLKLAMANSSLLLNGLSFASALLTILTAHEMGHYLACRYYGVDATLPFFLPAPPLFLAGTFGAFIKMKSPIPTRRALFDVGLAGPLAGFVVLLPFAVIGTLALQPAPPSTGSVIIFNDPLLIRMIGKAAGVNLTDALPNPFYMAAWIGLLVTSLNLMPVGQLDGGHGTFALFGPNAHTKIGRVAFFATAVTAGLGFIWYGSPSGFLYTILLAVMLRVRHPAPEVMEPLGTARIVVAVITLLVFLLSFSPFPIVIT